MGDVEELTKEEIKSKLEGYERRGFNFFPSWTIDKPITPDRIKLPSGKIMGTEEIDNFLSNGKLIAGDAHSINIVDAMLYYDLVREMRTDDRYMRYTTSFDGDEDLENCRVRYMGN